MHQLNRRSFISVGITACLATNNHLRAHSSPGPISLRHQIQDLADKHKGKVAVGYKHLKLGQSWSINPDLPMPTASLIKFPVMVEAYRQADSKHVSLDTMITLKKEDKVPGSGILTYDFSPGATLSLRDAIRLMIKFSDNTATNLVLDQIGIASTGKTMISWGYPNTRIHAKVFKRETSVAPERSQQFGLGSTTVNEMINLFDALHQGKLVSESASKEMYEHLRTCDDTQKFPRLLPYGTKLAFKTGSVNASRTAAGIMETVSGPVALCVLTNENQDQSWSPDNAGDLLCAHIAKVVFDQFNTKS